MHDTVEFAERPDAPRSHITLRLIAQDPSVTGDDGRILTAQVKVPWSRIEDGPRGARLHVVDYDVAVDEYRKHPALVNEDAYAAASDEVLLTDKTFHAQQVYGAAAKTLATFESALGRRLSWSFAGHHLYLVPHAFAEANAYYSWEDRAVLFGYVPAEDEDDPPVYTCLSYDIIVHETTHAILDGLRRRFLEPGLPDQAAFHEGFADIVALLSVFSMRPVVEQALGRARQERPDHAHACPPRPAQGAACSRALPSRSGECSLRDEGRCAAPPCSRRRRTGHRSRSSPSRTVAARCSWRSCSMCSSTSGRPGSRRCSPGPATPHRPPSTGPAPPRRARRPQPSCSPC